MPPFELYQRPTAGGGGGGSVAFGIAISQTDVCRNGRFEIKMASGLYRFGSAGITYEVTVDGVAASFTVVDGGTIYVTCPNTAAIGSGKTVVVSITPSGGTAVTASGVIDVVAGAVFVRTTDFAANDIFNYLGTAEGTAAFTNPQSLSAVSFATALQNGGAAVNITDRNLGTEWSVNRATLANYAHMYWEFVGTRRVQPTNMAFRGRNGIQSIHLRSFQLQASTQTYGQNATTQDESNQNDWDILVNYYSTTAFTNSVWYNFPINPGVKNYRSFRIVATSTNEATTSFVFALTEIQLWGTYRPA